MPRKPRIPDVPESDNDRIEREKFEDALKGDNAYDKLKKQDLPRKVELPAYKPPGQSGQVPAQADGSSGSGYKTISQAMEQAVDLTDMQYALSILIPKEDKINYGSLMIADISPEVFLPGFHMSAMNEIMCSDPRKPIDVNKIYMKHYTIWSIGLDREGRMDVADISGAARAEKKLQSTLGLRGIS